MAIESLHAGGATGISVDFTLPYGPNGLVDVVTGDFDGDGKPDIATAGYFGVGLQSTSTLSVLLNDGNGGFLAPLDRFINREPVDIVTADFDGSGLTSATTVDFADFLTFNANFNHSVPTPFPAN